MNFNSKLTAKLRTAPHTDTAATSTKTTTKISTTLQFHTCVKYRQTVFSELFFSPSCSATNTLIDSLLCLLMCVPLAFIVSFALSLPLYICFSFTRRQCMRVCMDIISPIRTQCERDVCVVELDSQNT